VGGSAANAVYSIVFKGYNTTEQVSGSALRPARPDAPSASASTSASTSTAGLKRGQPLLTLEEEAERERKRKRNEKKTERSESKTAAAKEKATSWQKFAKKGAKKGYGIAGAEGKSMFKTPDDPLARGEPAVRYRHAQFADTGLRAPLSGCRGCGQGHA
jgi:survival-of-motor-neuron-related-splicing factor 30